MLQLGDIGIKPGEVEKNMDNHFRLAHKWGCVLLLDEADVFLAKRDVCLHLFLVCVALHLLQTAKRCPKKWPGFR
jgi:hypothetical protein